ncbi:imidazolonepropionase [Umboniibacter marinipuniceus]|uniref:Imidazolonepropionase n=1 Tax=Umboniibacter marinipuniceus TaxID=569599 RepID=A0A3M0A4M1_9GAMM|nr:imidazolonepropionase [Umboniibacter marinipuniceus]RMA79983.1 imidazolonepropionase [Umboniibacter marinipuniceus]
MFFDLIIKNANLALTGNTVNSAELNCLYGASVGIKDGIIEAIWEADKAQEASSSKVIDASGQWLLPGFLDCHTHLVFAGNRADEFARRARGESYQQIAASGGGILSTVRATREASEDELFEVSLVRAKALVSGGVTHLEIKSGYGLDWDNEAKMLRVAQRIGTALNIEVSCTYLGAHALPPEYSTNRAAYVDIICNNHLPKLAQLKLASAVDMFCEGIGFNASECERIICAAQALGLKIKAHAEQLSRSGGAALIAQYQGLSADHIEYLSLPDIKAMAKNNVVGVLLPGAFYTLNDTQKPPIDALRNAGVTLAVSTDLNPGSSPIGSLLLVANMAVNQFQLTIEEALWGITLHAAKALGIEDSRGSIAVGKRADVCLWPIETPEQLIVEIGLHAPTKIWSAGREINL